MTHLRPHLVRVVAVLSLLPLIARAEFPSNQPFPGITYGHAERSDPPMSLYWVMVDLADPSISLRVCPGGSDPDGEGPYQTVLARTSDVAARNTLDVAVNGDFFAAKPPADPEAARRYSVGQWAMATGPAMTDGRRWSNGAAGLPCLVVSVDRRASIGLSNTLPADARQIVAGNVMLVRNGKKVAPANPAEHPRTAVGLDKSGTRLVLLVVDGRRQFYSIGMDYSGLADEMIRLGCDSAMNLDGGGSTALVLYDPGARQHRILNRPSDGPERPVANVLGIRSKAGSASTRPASGQ